MTEYEESRQHLFQQIQMLCAGEDADVVLMALKDALSAVVGFMSTNDRDAENLIRETVRQLHISVELNRKAIQEMRLQCQQIMKSQQ